MENFSINKLEELKRDIEAMRGILNEAVEGMTKGENNKILDISSRMDKLIVEYYSMSNIRI